MTNRLLDSTINTEQELITLVISLQDQAAFTELVTRYQSPIRQFARRLTAGDYHAADDIAQETFWLAYQKLHTFSGKGSFKSWLHTIAYRQFLKHIKQHNMLELDEQQPVLISEPQSELEADLLAEKLMLKLSAEERVVMTLSISAAMSHSDIAAITEMPLGTVKSHIQRAKVKLHKVLDKSLLVA